MASIAKHKVIYTVISVAESMTIKTILILKLSISPTIDQLHLHIGIQELAALTQTF